MGDEIFQADSPDPSLLHEAIVELLLHLDPRRMRVQGHLDGEFPDVGGSPALDRGDVLHIMGQYLSAPEDPLMNLLACCGELHVHDLLYATVIDGGVLLELKDGVVDVVLLLVLSGLVIEVDESVTQEYGKEVWQGLAKIRTCNRSRRECYAGILRLVRGQKFLVLSGLVIEVDESVALKGEGVQLVL